MVVVVWDEAKRAANLLKHGLDFTEFEDRFDFESAIQVPARPSRTGRLRFAIVGELDGDLPVVAIVSPLGTEALSLVSLRRASPRERQAYGF